MLMVLAQAAERPPPRRPLARKLQHHPDGYIFEPPVLTLTGKHVLRTLTRMIYGTYLERFHGGTKSDHVVHKGGRDLL